MMQNGISVSAKSAIVEHKGGIIVVYLYDFTAYDSTALQDVTFTKVSDKACELQGIQRLAFHWLSTTHIGFKEVNDEILTQLEFDPKDLLFEPKRWGKKEYQYLTRDCFYKQPKTPTHIEINAPYMLRDYRG